MALICARPAAAVRADSHSVETAHTGPLPAYMPITARDKMMMVAGSELNTSADARLTAVSIRGREACQMRSPVSSDRRRHQIITTEARAKGMELRSPVCMLVRPYALMICGCQS